MCGCVGQGGDVCSGAHAVPDLDAAVDAGLLAPDRAGAGGQGGWAAPDAGEGGGVLCAGAGAGRRVLADEPAGAQRRPPLRRRGDEARGPCAAPRRRLARGAHGRGRAERRAQQGHVRQLLPVDGASVAGAARQAP
eukprot:2239797-Rhodomonas_salina.1